MAKIYLTLILPFTAIFSLFSNYLVHFILLVSFFPLYANELPDLGNPASIALTPSQELELGLAVMKALQAAQVISQDAIVNEYLQGLGYRLIATQGRAQPSYRFFAIKDSTINAFALPGGFVGVNTGLILTTEGESELAGILAHEVAHVQQKHIARMYQHMNKLRLSTIAGIIAAMVISTQNPQAGSGAMAAALAGNQQALINFTREHEKEADYVGIHTLAKAGFDPMGMPSFFHRMYQNTRYYSSHIPEYLLTHPLTENRLMAAQTRAKSFPYRQIPDNILFHLVQARVLVHSFAIPHEASRFLAEKLAQGHYRNRLGTLYGYALALIEEGKPEQAKPSLEELITVSPNQPLFQQLYAQMEMALGQSLQATQRLANALKNHPNNHPLTLAYAQALIKTKSASQAIALLKKHSLHHASAEIYHLLSAAYAQLKQSVQAHRAQAQYLKLQGDLEGALTQLKLARKSASVQEQQQIDFELKEIQLNLKSSGYTQN